MKIWIAIVYTILIIAVSFLLGYVLSFTVVDVSGIIFTVTFVLLAGLMITNLIINRKIVKKYGFKQFKNRMLDFKEKSDNDTFNYESSVKHLKKIFNLATAYIVLVIVLNALMLASSFGIVIHESNGPGFIFIILPFFVILSLMLSLYKTKKIYLGEYLDSKQYPKLYQIIDAVKKDLNYHKPILLYVQDNNNVIVTYHLGVYQISFGIIPLLMLGDEEIKSILYHELGHVLHKDTYNLSKRSAFTEGLEQIGNSDEFMSIAALYVSSLAKYLTIEHQIHDIIISKTQENRSDDLVLSKGMNRAFISAGIKMAYFGYFYEDLDIVSVNLSNAEPSATYYEDIYHEYLEKIEDRKERYQYYIHHEIEAKRATHPVLRSRMEKFGINHFDVMPYASYDADEVWSILKVIQTVTPQMKENYLRQRQMYYVESLSIIEKQNNQFSEDEESLSRYGLALFYTRQLSLAAETFEKLVELYPNSALGHFYVGFLKLRTKDDKSGIESIYRAAKLSPSYVDNTEEIVIFAQKMGLQDELDKVKVEFLDMKQATFDHDYHEVTNITKKAVFLESEAPDPLKQQFIDLMDKYELDKGFFVKRPMADGHEVDIIFLTYGKKSKVFAIYDELNELIRAQMKPYEVSLIGDRRQMKLLEKQVKAFYDRTQKKKD